VAVKVIGIEYKPITTWDGLEVLIGENPAQARNIGLEGLDR
jgi:hypothetical protein